MKHLSKRNPIKKILTRRLTRNVARLSHWATREAMLWLFDSDELSYKIICGFAVGVKFVQHKGRYYNLSSTTLTEELPWMVSLTCKFTSVLQYRAIRWGSLEKTLRRRALGN